MKSSEYKHTVNSITSGKRLESSQEQWVDGFSLLLCSYSCITLWFPCHISKYQCL